MSKNAKLIALALSAIIIFTVGIFWGMRMARPNQVTHAPDSTSAGNTASLTSTTADSTQRANDRRADDTKKSLLASPEHEKIMRDIRDATLLPRESRTMPLLKALEETTKLPLSKDLLDEMRRIVDEGEIESSHYVLSLMEQREEKSSVDLLLHAASHKDRDVADRALFALEAVAGAVFKNRDEAATWAATWQPDPERVKLFAPGPDKEAENAITTDSRLPGPRGQAPKGTAQKQE